MTRHLFFVAKCHGTGSMDISPNLRPPSQIMQLFRNTILIALLQGSTGNLQWQILGTIRIPSQIIHAFLVLLYGVTGNALWQIRILRSPFTNHAGISCYIARGTGRCSMASTRNHRHRSQMIHHFSGKTTNKFRTSEKHHANVVPRTGVIFIGKHCAAAAAAGSSPML